MLLRRRGLAGLWQLQNRQRTALLSAFFVLLLVTSLGSNPYAAHASTLQLHGALSRDTGVGIISHRGAAAVAPENTLAALRIAFEHGVDFVEVDLRLTADGVPVLMHDDRVDRTTNGVGDLASLTLEQVKLLDAGGWYAPEYAGEQVPTLVEFLDEVTPTNTRALIELKGLWNDEQIAHAVALLSERYLMDRVAIVSFEVENLQRLEQLAPEFARVMLTREWNGEVLDLAASLGVSAIGARTKVFKQDFGLIEDANRLGIGTMVYTLNKQKQWKEAHARGIDLVVTDNPGALEEWCALQDPLPQGNDS